MAVWPGLSIFLLVLSFNLWATDCATRSTRDTVSVAGWTL